MLVWSILIGAVFWAFLCMATLFRRQWIDRERLSFPLAYLPLALVDTGGPQAWWRNRLFWLGAAVAGGIEIVNGLNYPYPAVPYLPVKVTQIPAAPMPATATSRNRALHSRNRPTT